MRQYRRLQLLSHLTVAAAVVSFGLNRARAEAPLRLAQSIELPGVFGRIDHFAIDLPNDRLFIAALGNDSVEVIDLRKGGPVRSITGLGHPQGVGYFSESGRLIVANDRGGACNIYDGNSFAVIGRVDLKDDADNVRCDGKQAYVGFGSGGIAVIDPVSAKIVRSFKLTGHPEGFVLEKNGPRIFANVPDAHQVAVIDREQGRWSGLGGQAARPQIFRWRLTKRGTGYLSAAVRLLSWWF